MQVELQGLSLSLIDNEPKEFALITLREVIFSLRSWNEIRSLDSKRELNTHTYASLGHMQIDNMLPSESPVIFAPTKKYDPTLERIGVPPDQIKEEVTVIEEVKEDPKSKKKKKKGDKNKEIKPEIRVPFLQFDLIFSKLKSSNSIRIGLMEMILQQLALKVEQSGIEMILKFVIIVQQALADKSEEFNLTNRHLEVETNLQDLLEERSVVYKELIPTTPQITKDKALPFPRIYMDALHLGAISLIVSYKFEKSED